MEDGVELEDFLNKMIVLINKKIERQRVENALLEKRLMDAMKEQNTVLTQQIRTLQEHQTSLTRRLAEIEKSNKVVRSELLKQLEQ